MKNVDEVENIPAFLLSLTVFVVILLSMITIVTLMIINTGSKKNIAAVNDTEEQCAVEETPEWEYLIQALIMVESEGNALAVGKTNDVGILQITPIYVREVNRILQQDTYNLSDRTDIDKSLAMFEVYQEHHNPDKDIERAIKLHNPRAGRTYRNKVIEQFNQLIQL